MPRLGKNSRETDEFIYDGPGADEPDADFVKFDRGGNAAAGYIADMAAQLEVLARADNLELLAYLLAMARAEADTLSRLPRAKA